MLDSKFVVPRRHERSGQRLADGASLIALMAAAMVSHAVPAQAAVTCGTHTKVEVCPPSGTYTNSGNISAATQIGVAVGSGTLLSSFTNSGTIIASTTAVLVDGSIGTLSNTGTLSATDYGLYVSATGTIDTISNGGSIQGSSCDAVFVDGHVGTFTNTGTIRSDSANGMKVGSTGVIANLNNYGVIWGTTSNGLGNEGSIGTLTNTGTIYLAGETGLDNSGTIDSLVNSGLILGETSYAIDNAGVIGSVTNSGTIASPSGSGIYNGGSIGTLSNSGKISGSSSAINNGGTIETLSNSGSIISSNEYALANGYYYSTQVLGGGTIGTLSNLGVISGSKGGISNIGTGLINTLINGQGGTGGGGDQPALTYEGNLPATYLEHISSTTHYGQLWVTNGVGSISDFDIAAGSTLASGTVTYGSVFTGVDMVEGSITGTIEGTFTAGSRVYDWDLVSSVSGIWDLIITSLITAPTAEDTVAVNLAVATQRLAAQFDQSNVIKHITEIGHCGSGEEGAATEAGQEAETVQSVCQTGDALATSTKVNKSTVYAEVRGSWADITAHGEGNENFSSDAAGAIVGVEQEIDSINATVGAFGSFSRVTSTAETARDEVSNTGVGAYISKKLGTDFRLDGYAAYYSHTHDLSRTFAASGYSANPKGRTFTSYARLSYSGLTHDTLSVRPYAALAYVNQSLDGYNETGDSGALSVDGHSDWNVQSWLGATIDANLPMSNGVIIRPQLDAALVHGIHDGAGSVTTTFVGEQDTYDAILSGQDQDYARIDASVAIEMSKNASMRIGYGTELGNADVKDMSEVHIEANIKF